MDGIENQNTIGKFLYLQRYLCISEIHRNKKMVDENLITGTGFQSQPIPKKEKKKVSN